MKALLTISSIILSISLGHSQIATQDFEGPLNAPWSGSGTSVGSQGGNWNVHGGGGMYELQGIQSIEVLTNLPATTKYIDLWVNEELYFGNSIFVSLCDYNTGNFIYNIGTYPAASSGYWGHAQFQLGAGYSGNYKIVFGRTYSTSTAVAYSTYIDDISISTNPTSIASFTNRSFKIYPNPITTGEFTLSLNAPIKQGSIEIYNGIGQQVYTETLISNINDQVKIKLPRLNSGIYTCKIFNGREYATQTLLIE